MDGRTGCISSHSKNEISSVFCSWGERSWIFTSDLIESRSSTHSHISSLLEYQIEAHDIPVEQCTVETQPPCLLTCWKRRYPVHKGWAEKTRKHKEVERPHITQQLYLLCWTDRFLSNKLQFSSNRTFSLWKCSAEMATVNMLTTVRVWGTDFFSLTWDIFGENAQKALHYIPNYLSLRLLDWDKQGKADWQYLLPADISQLPVPGIENQSEDLEEKMN